MLKLKEANCAIAAVLNHARDHGYCVSVTVCDPFGHLVAHQRMMARCVSQAITRLGKRLLQPGSAFRADKFLTMTCGDLWLVASLEAERR
jgi:hypothetical protein